MKSSSIVKGEPGMTQWTETWYNRNHKFCTPEVAVVYDSASGHWQLLFKHWATAKGLVCSSLRGS